MFQCAFYFKGNLAGSHCSVRQRDQFIPIYGVNEYLTAMVYCLRYVDMSYGGEE